jgi:hypothetical protein
MKIGARGVRFGLLLVLGLAAAPATRTLAQNPAQPLKERLVGHWQLVAVTVNGAKPYGANPQGSMFFDAGGHFSVIVISGGEARSIAYFGSYAVDDADKTLSLHVEGNSGGSGQSAAGRDLKRRVAFDGDELVMTSAMPAGAPGAPGGVKTTWKPAN